MKLVAPAEVLVKLISAGAQLVVGSAVKLGDGVGSIVICALLFPEQFELVF